MTVNRRLTFPVAALLLLFSANVCTGLVNPAHIKDAAEVVSMEDCLDCHDNSLHNPEKVHFGNYCLLNKEYPPAGREREFAGIAEVEKSGAVLEGGKVTCLSCHDLTKTSPHVIREGFALCSICHTTLNMPH